jgi:hypothetical protein
MFLTADSTWIFQMENSDGTGTRYRGSRTVELEQLTVNLDAGMEGGAVRAHVEVVAPSHTDVEFTDLFVEGHFGGLDGVQTLDLSGKGHRMVGKGNGKGKGLGGTPRAHDRSRSNDRSRSPH